MIGIYLNGKISKNLILVKSAFVRSFTESQVSFVESIHSLTNYHIICVVNPSECDADILLKWFLSENKKLIVFGKLPFKFLEEFNFIKSRWPNKKLFYASAKQALKANYSESPGKIIYRNKPFFNFKGKFDRSLERFDFLKEWNNLNYGAIKLDKSMWGVSQAVKADRANEVAALYFDSNIYISYISVVDKSNSSFIWVNRPAGLIDSYEWHLIEEFISNYSNSKLPCYPYICDLPYGYDSAITMRLDCDESLISLGPIINFYKKLNIPLSLAIPAHLLSKEKPLKLIKKKIDSSSINILSHSLSHPMNWGGNYVKAKYEARKSKEVIEDFFDITIKYAVSPFHQSPRYSLKALKDSGYDGCVGGLISCNPEFNLARGGQIFEDTPKFIGHSQQVMLHGDCMLSKGDSLKIYKKSYILSYMTNSIFGFLDHPFSPRYSYGWKSEKYRLSIHENLINFISHSSKNTIFLSENDALDLLMSKTRISFVKRGSKFIVKNYNQGEGRYRPTLVYKGKKFDSSRDFI